jgi:hypothetical protein
MKNTFVAGAGDILSKVFQLAVDKLRYSTKHFLFFETHSLADDEDDRENGNKFENENKLRLETGYLISEFHDFTSFPDLL